MNARWFQLRNKAWGIKVRGATVDKGVSLTVTKRNGETNEVTITRVLATYDKDGEPESICTVKRVSREESTPEPRTERDDTPDFTEELAERYYGGARAWIYTG